MLFFSIVILAVGLKYFPFARVVKMPAAPEKEFSDPEKVHNQSPHTLYYDFEVAAGKEVPARFYKGLAHSGQYSVKAFGQNSFSVAVERTASEIGLENLKAVAISAWIYVFPTTTEVKGHLVFTASNQVGVNVCWESAAVVEPEVPRGKWFKISKYLDLTPVAFKPGYKIQVYFWNNSSTDILIDDYFIAFGGAVDRRGDSARVDMTKPAGYVAKLNYPPFPVSMLEMQPTDKPINPADIGPGDLFIAGNFFGTGKDGLVVIGKDGRLTSYAYCTELRKFLKATLSNPAGLTAVGTVKKILKGNFLTSREDQLILAGDKGWAVGVVSLPEKLCTGAGNLQASLQFLWKSEIPEGSLFAGDFNGDGRSEILSVAGNGSWKVMSFEPDRKSGGAWKVISRDEGSPLNEWDRGKQEIGISVGRFYPSQAMDVVLTVTRNKSDGRYAYSLRKLNAAANKWDPLFNEKQGYVGKTHGLDTLKPTDQFFAVPGNDNKTAIFRYNRDWRFDLKEIRFSDTAFTILSGVDFHGYAKDQNPKYYESLKLVPGCFLNASEVSIIAIGHVSKSRQYQSLLPDFVQIYALPVNK